MSVPTFEPGAAGRSTDAGGRSTREGAHRAHGAARAAGEPIGRALPGLPAAVRRAAILNLGCKVNQSEVEAAGRLLRERGVEIVDARERADLVIVNTCTVTAVADQKSRQAVRRARRASPDGALVVTGCSVQVDPGSFHAADPAAHLVGNAGKAALLDELAGLLATVEGPVDPLRGPLPTLAGVEPVGSSSAPIEGIADGRTAVDRTRAFVKVQDGCSFHCTYCIIPRARGAERSLPPDVVLADVRRALAAGHREVVLTGINIGTYDGGWSEAGPRGSHARSALTLAGLVRRILDETGVERIRLSSIEPQHVDEALLDAWTGPGAGRCLPHFHLPLQSGDDGVLRRMGRRYDSAFYADLAAWLRERLPDVALHADVIAGFPTEDDEAFERTVAFVGSLRLDGFHVFRYSSRPGTAATRMVGQVPDHVRRARATALLGIAETARRRRAAGSVGSVRSVLVEERLPDGRWLGHAEDHQLVAIAPAASIGENALVQVAIEGIDPVDRARVGGRALAISPGRPIRLPLPVGPGAPVAPPSAAPSMGGAHVQ